MKRWRGRNIAADYGLTLKTRSESLEKIKG
ncbi:hypothetical protein M2322_001029 [Rhodoblastus acidophilus]|nr:hypothetical protein [Rhodoblastus acidophilus]